MGILTGLGESVGKKFFKKEGSEIGSRSGSKILQRESKLFGPKTKILGGATILGGLDYYFGGGDDSFAGGIIKDIKNAAQVVKIIFYLVIVLVVVVVGYNLLSLLVSLFKSSKKSDPQGEFHNSINSTYAVAVPDSEKPTVKGSQTGGGKNNLDKYMYCLILLLGIGIHHLYDSYNTKKDKYLDLLKEKEEYDKLF